MEIDEYVLQIVLARWNLAGILRDWEESLAVSHGVLLA